MAGLALLALVACVLTFLAGLAVALTYTERYGWLQSAGFTLQHLRPIHESSAFAWLFLGGVAVVHFTNYGHHTYHLRQSPWIHWISFVVSMLEVVILAKLLVDVTGLARARPAAIEDRVSTGFARSATLWTFLMLALAILISVPPINTLVHGTHVVSMHVMGSMIGIDSMILWSAMAFLVRDLAGAGHPAVRSAAIYRLIRAINALLFVFLATYLLKGAAVGWARYAGPAAGDLSELEARFPTILMFSGLGLCGCVLAFIGRWMAALASVWAATLGSAAPARALYEPNANAPWERG